jgi:cytochrome o ubiquinol oxidase subunit 3
MTKTARNHVGLNLRREGELTGDEVQTGLFGFWVFLMSDAVIFALLFATYGVMLAATAGGPTALGEFKMGSAGLETLILLTSSFTYGMASIALKYEARRGGLLGWLGVTLALGLVFLALEVHDFTSMFADGASPMRSGFLSAVFALVPLHGLHVLVGGLWIAVMMVQVVVIGLDARVKLNLLRLGLFWHFLDIIWIAIFTLVYLHGLIR